jgi:hypothetical protein
MKANRMLSIVCVLALCALAACSDSSQPAGPDGSTINRKVMADDGSTAAPAPATPRPIGDFLAAQGTYCVDDMNGGCRLYVPPVRNYLAWIDRGQDMVLSVDYAGIADRWLQESTGGKQTLGTQINGDISEQPRDDGRALVTVDMHIANAMSFIGRGPDLQQPAIIGYQPTELLDGSNRPALGNALLHLVFINSAPGAPMPDLVQLITAPQPGQQLLDMQFQYDGNGSWRGDGYVPVHISASENGPIAQPYPGDPTFAPMGDARITVQ